MKPLHAVEVDFHPENSVTTRYKYMSLTHAEKSGIWRLTAAEWTEAVHRHDEKAEFVSVLQNGFNGVPLPFCKDFLYTVVVTASPKRIPEPQFRNQKPPNWAN